MNLAQNENRSELDTHRSRSGGPWRPLNDLRKTRERLRRVINLVRIQSLRPETMAIGLEFYRHLMDGPGGPTRLRRVLIATVVTKINGCRD